MENARRKRRPQETIEWLTCGLSRKKMTCSSEISILLSSLFDKLGRFILACVADALNLLYIDYTKGLDDCVGRLQRRLVHFYSKEVKVNHF